MGAQLAGNGRSGRPDAACPGGGRATLDVASFSRSSRHLAPPAPVGFVKAVRRRRRGDPERRRPSRTTCRRDRWPDLRDIRRSPANRTVLFSSGPCGFFGFFFLGFGGSCGFRSLQPTDALTKAGQSRPRLHRARVSPRSRKLARRRTYRSRLGAMLPGRGNGIATGGA